MTPTVQALGIDKLSADEQLALVRAIWDHIAASGPIPRLSDAQRQELRRRVADDEASPDDVIPWEQVRAEARKRTGR
jgi:putative addiction module component (TIGR02574 family)